MKRIYLDYAAATPLDTRVMRAMRPYYAEKFGNSGALHSFGQEAQAAIDKSRETIARALGANFREIVFTGSATEANNLALRGITRSFTRNCAEFHREKLLPKLIVSAIEHESVRETARDLKQDGVEVVYIPVDANGIVDIKKIEEHLDERTVLISVMYVNNEIGTIQPISKIAEIIRRFRETTNHKLQTTSYPLFHTDAVQAFQYLDCNVQHLGVDLLTISSHKIYGPKGAGALYIRDQESGIGDRKSGVGNQISPIITGGGQEYGLRSGTVNTPAIVGFAEAVKEVIKIREQEKKRTEEIRNLLWREIKKIFPNAQLNGVPEIDSPLRVPHAVSIHFPGFSSDDLLIRLDMVGIAASSGAACRARTTKPSHVLKALGYDDARVASSIRFSLGKFTTKKEIIETAKRLKKILNV